MRSVFLSAGHSNRPGRDRGAAGNGYIEGELAVEFRNILKNELEILGKEHGVDLLFYGHTHRFYLEEKEGIIFCNPGSASFPRDGKKSFVLWDTGKNNLKRIFL